MEYGIANNRPFGYVEGKPQMSDVTPDAEDQIDAGFEFFDRGGTQTGSHPAKSQPKVPHWIE